MRTEDSWLGEENGKAKKTKAKLAAEERIIWQWLEKYKRKSKTRKWLGTAGKKK